MSATIGLFTPSLSPEEAQTLTFANMIVSYLSILGSLFNLLTTLMIRKTWTTLGWMIVALSLSDILIAITTILLRFENTSDFLCQCISFFSAFGNINSFIWTCCFGHALLSSMKQVEVRFLKRFWKKYTLISLSVSASLGIVSIYTNFYSVGVEPVPNYCLHRTKHNTFDLGSLLVLLLPSMLSAFYCIYCYIVVIRYIRESGSRIYSELLLFPLILIICNIPICIVGILEQLKINYDVPFGFILASNILWNIEGLLNAFAYGLSQKILFGYKELCCKRKNKENMSRTLLSSADYTSNKASFDESNSQPSFHNNSRCSIPEEDRK